MATHDGGKRETRARMKDRQCTSAIVCRQAQGPKQTHGAEWQCLGMGGFGSREKERQKDSKMMLWSNTHKNSGEKNNSHFKNVVARTPTLTWRKWGLNIMVMEALQRKNKAQRTGLPWGEKNQTDDGRKKERSWESDGRNEKNIMKSMKECKKRSVTNPKCQCLTTWKNKSGIFDKLGMRLYVLHVHLNTCFCLSCIYWFHSPPPSNKIRGQRLKNALVNHIST